jgi:hypothetical protein
MIIHLYVPKTNDAPNKTDVLAQVNAALTARKLQKPRREKTLTALGRLQRINKALHFTALRAVSRHRK